MLVAAIVRYLSFSRENGRFERFRIIIYYNQSDSSSFEYNKNNIIFYKVIYV